MNLNPTAVDLSGARAVIFDVDGTLVDSERDGHRVAFNLAFEAAGLHDRWDEDCYGDLLAVTGGRRRLRRYLMSRGYGAVEADQLARRLHTRKTTFMRELIEAGVVPLRPGVESFVTALEAAGTELSIATTGSRAWVEPLLERHFGPNRFRTVVTGTEILTLKPDPAVYLEVVRLSAHSAHDCVAIEDSRPGVAAALAAGLRCIAVSNDFTHHHDFTGASHVATSFEDLASVIGIPALCSAAPGPDAQSVLGSSR